MSKQSDTKIDDGGPAFPSKRVRAHGERPPVEIVDNGMSLRDYFAGQALAGICSDCKQKRVTEYELAQIDHLRVTAAYRIADAMLSHRKGASHD